MKRRFIGSQCTGVYWDGAEVLIEAETIDQPCNPSLFLGYPDGTRESGIRYEEVAVFKDWEARSKFTEAMEAVIGYAVAKVMREEWEDTI